MIGSSRTDSFRRTGPIARALAALCLAAGSADAVPYTHYGFSGASGVFAVSCSGPANGGLPHNGTFDNRNWFGAGSDCTANPLTPVASSSFTSGNVTASGQGTAGFGVLAGATSMSTDQQSAVLFPAGFVDLGWIDTLTIVNPALNGQVATVTANLHVSGSLNAAGPNVFSRLNVIASSELQGPNNFQNTHQVQAPAPGQIFDEILSVNFQFVVGTASQFIVRAQGQSMTSSQTSFGNNTANVNFLNTLSWGGIQSIKVGGVDITPDAVNSASGVDWTQAADLPVPAPAALPLMLAGLVSAMVLRRRPRRGG